jgi:hypothetical protein
VRLHFSRRVETHPERSSGRVSVVCLALAAVVFLSLSRRVKAQQSSAGEIAPLILTAQIPLPGVHGRFDHFAFDPTEPGRVFISALGNNSMEVINLVEETEAHRITGIPKPQGIAYAPGLNKIFVGSRKGTLYVYDGSSYKLIASIVYNADVDNLRYEAASKPGEGRPLGTGLQVPNHVWSHGRQNRRSPDRNG